MLLAGRLASSSQVRRQRGGWPRPASSANTRQKAKAAELIDMAAGKDDELAHIRRQRGLRLRAEVRAGNYDAEAPAGTQRAPQGSVEDVAQEHDEGPALGG